MQSRGVLPTWGCLVIFAVAAGGCGDECEVELFECRGTVIHSCSAEPESGDLVEEEYDCADENAVCAEGEDDFAACVLPAREPCDPEDDNRCSSDGQSVEYCSTVEFWSHLYACDSGQSCVIGDTGPSCG